MKLRRRSCPNCGSRATKIINISESTSTCQICSHIEYLHEQKNEDKI